MRPRPGTASRLVLALTPGVSTATVVGGGSVITGPIGSVDGAADVGADSVGVVSVVPLPSSPPPLVKPPPFEPPPKLFVPSLDAGALVVVVVGGAEIDTTSAAAFCAWVLSAPLNGA